MALRDGGMALRDGVMAPREDMAAAWRPVTLADDVEVFAVDDFARPVLVDFGEDLFGGLAHGQQVIEDEFCGRTWAAIRPTSGAEV